MTSIQRFVQITAAFDPEATRTLGQAFDMACALLGRTRRQRYREAIAKNIIEVAKAGGARSGSPAKGRTGRAKQQQRSVGAREATAHDGPPVLPLALVALNQFEHAHERDEHYRDGGPCDFEEQSCPPARGTRMKFRARPCATCPLCWRYAVLRCWARPAQSATATSLAGRSYRATNQVRSSPRLASRKPKRA